MLYKDTYVFDRNLKHWISLFMCFFLLNFVPKQIVGMSQKSKLMVPSYLTVLCWSLTHVNCYKLTAPLSPCHRAHCCWPWLCWNWMYTTRNRFYNNTHHRRTTEQCMAAVVVATTSTPPMRFSTGRARWENSQVEVAGYNCAIAHFTEEDVGTLRNVCMGCQNK